MPSKEDYSGNNKSLEQMACHTKLLPDKFKKESQNLVDIAQAPVVQRPDNFIRWIRHYSGSKIYFTLNVVPIFRTLPNLAVRVCIFTCMRGNTEIFAQIETVG